MSALDRDAARSLLYPMLHGKNPEQVERVLDALEGCVRPTPQQTIDREKAKAVFRQRYIEHTTGDQALDYLERCLRPVDGVTLTREEAVMAAYALRHSTDENGWNTPPMRALAARLEAAS